MIINRHLSRAGRRSPESGPDPVNDGLQFELQPGWSVGLDQIEMLLHGPDLSAEMLTGLTELILKIDDDYLCWSLSRQPNLTGADLHLLSLKSSRGLIMANIINHDHVWTKTINRIIYRVDDDQAEMVFQNASRSPRIKAFGLYLMAKKTSSETVLARIVDHDQASDFILRLILTKSCRAQTRRAALIRLKQN